jgi:hypothetical protein
MEEFAENAAGGGRSSRRKMAAPGVKCSRKKHRTRIGRPIRTVMQEQVNSLAPRSLFVHTTAEEKLDTAEWNNVRRDGRMQKNLQLFHYPLVKLDHQQLKANGSKKMYWTWMM